MSNGPRHTDELDLFAEGPRLWNPATLQLIVEGAVGERQFIVVTNREPYTHRLEAGEVVWERGVSGVVTALEPVVRVCRGSWVAHGSGNADREVVDADNRVISTGYNGPVAGLPHDVVPLERPAKYDWFIHAEDNAVAFARCDLRGATAYVTGEACAACFRRLLQVGVRRIVFGDRQSACLTESELQACRTMADRLGVRVEHHPAPACV